MLTGPARLPAATTAAETMTAILKEDAAGARGRASGRCRRGSSGIVRRCLEKNPDERFQSARDLAFALEAISVSDVSGALPARPPRFFRRRAALAGALLLAAAALGLTCLTLLGTGYEAWRARRLSRKYQSLTFTARLGRGCALSPLRQHRVILGKAGTASPCASSLRASRSRLRRTLLLLEVYALRPVALRRAGGRHPSEPIYHAKVHETLAQHPARRRDDARAPRERERDRLVARQTSSPWCAHQASARGSSSLST